MVGVPQQPSVLLLRQGGHPAFAVGRLEVVLAGADDLVGFVKEQHGDSSR